MEEDCTEYQKLSDWFEIEYEESDSYEKKKSKKLFHFRKNKNLISRIFFLC